MSKGISQPSGKDPKTQLKTWSTRESVVECVFDHTFVSIYIGPDRGRAHSVRGTAVPAGLVGGLADRHVRAGLHVCVTSAARYETRTPSLGP